jgi:hypothetical protein
MDILNDACESSSDDDVKKPTPIWPNVTTMYAKEFPGKVLKDATPEEQKDAKDRYKAAAEKYAIAKKEWDAAHPDDVKAPKPPRKRGGAVIVPEAPSGPHADVILDALETVAKVFQAYVDNVKKAKTA